MNDAYRQFLESKVAVAPRLGFDVADSEIHPILKPHQRAIVRWMIAGGRRACFARFGLGKTVIQIEAVRITIAHAGGMGLIVAPLGVRGEFMHDAAMLGVPLTFIRRIEEATDPNGLYITNYETVRDGKLDPRVFTCASLDEASCLRGFGGTKTFRQFMALFAGDDRAAGVRSEGVPYRYVATATPSPNEYIELLAYSAYLDVMDVGQAKTRFFKRNSEKADQLTIHAHKEAEFWLWIASWAIFVQTPSDLSADFSDEGYSLPPLNVIWHEIPTDHRNAGTEKDGQGKLFCNAALGVMDASKEKRNSLEPRVACLSDIVREGGHGTTDQVVIWCDLNDEQDAIEHALKAQSVAVSSLRGSMDIDHREAEVSAWKERQTTAFLSKPVMYGAGVNLQQAHTMIFAGIGFKAQDILQAIHRIWRFLQAHPCDVHFIYTEAERDIRRQFERKWEQHNTMVGKMTDIIREFGLAHAASAAALARSLGVERVEASGENYRCINNDCVEETRTMDADSVDLIVTSIPFATQYEYTPSYNDFGHTDDNAHFWAQMDFLIPNLLRVLKPGRVACIHVKDRITPGGVNGLGFQTVQPFSDECVAAFQKHGFAFLSRVTVVTDVVRENNQTYRLGWTEQCKDGSRMGNGMPEYVLKFRKPPTDRSNGYADVPIAKDKADYTRARWQYDAHGLWRSSGNRPLTPDELEGLDQAAIFKLFRKHSLSNVYDFRHDVRIAEGVDKSGWLPTTFMLLQPQSWHPEVWTDITRMRTLNGAQAAKGKEMHLCPLQFDIVDRCIEQHSMPGETVLDPFGGLMTVPYCAIKLGRKGVGIELNNRYYLDGAAYCAAAERDMSMPSLFDTLPEDMAA